MTFWEAALRLLGRKGNRPMSPDEEWPYAGETGRALGALDKGRPETDDTAGDHRDGAVGEPAGGTPYDEHCEGEVLARGSVRSKRQLKHLARTGAKGESNKNRARNHHKVAEEHKATRPENVRPGTLDLFVSSPLLYVASYASVIVVLETTGMLASLVAFDATLGRLRDVMSVAAGGILLLAGHSIGKLVHKATQGNNARGYLAGAMIVALLAFGAIGQLAPGRDRNIEASAQLRQAGELRANASELEAKAARLEAPKPVRARRQGTPPSRQDRRAAGDLRRRADVARQDAAALEAAGRKKRTLAFFLTVQALGLGVGGVGGFFFASGSETREYLKRTRKAWFRERRAAWRDGRALKFHAKARDAVGRVRLIVVEEIGWVMSSHGEFLRRYAEARGSARSLPAPLRLDPDEITLRIVGHRLETERRANAAVLAAILAAYSSNGNGAHGPTADTVDDSVEAAS
jgi:hypothetical protein